MHLSSSRPFQRDQEHNLKHPSLVDLISTNKTNKLQQNPFIIMPLVTTSFVKLMNCDLNLCSHIPYKPLQDCDYKQKKNFKKILTK